MLDIKKTQSFTDTIHKSIPYSGIEEAVIGTPVYNRLHRILQNSMAYLTYPSNKVKRFEHSIGTMHIAGKIFYYSICNASPDILSIFLADIEKILSDWRKEVTNDKLYFIAPDTRKTYTKNKIFEIPIPDNKLYSRYTPGNLQGDKEKLIYLITFQAIRLAGLLHDVGHLPYSHVLEHAFQKLYLKVLQVEEKERNNSQKHFLQIMTPYCNDSEKDEIHENIGKLLTEKIYSSITDEISQKLDASGLFFAMTFYMAKKILTSKQGEVSVFSDLHSITAGTLDADRLDYCTRDGFSSGLNSGKFNYERLLPTFRLMTDDKENDLLPWEQEEGAEEAQTKKYFFCPNVKTYDQIEDLLIRRWNIFTHMNFHHRVHKHETILAEVISSIGFSELESENTDSSTTDVLPLQISSIWQLISQLETNEDLIYQIIQLDDSWIDTLLRNKFFTQYSSNYFLISKNWKDPLWSCFDELISSRKHYISLIKRTSDFKIFDELLYKKTFEKLNEEPHSSFLLELYNDYMKDIQYSEFISEQRSLFWNFLLQKYVELRLKIRIQVKDFYTKVEEQLNDIVSECTEEIRTIQFLVRSCEFKTGISEVKNIVKLYSSDNLNDLNKVSDIKNTLKRKKRIAPLFHVYYLPVYDTEQGSFKSSDELKLFDLLASTFLSSLIEYIKDEIKNDEESDI